MRPCLAICDTEKVLTKNTVLAHQLRDALNQFQQGKTQQPMGLGSFVTFLICAIRYMRSNHRYHLVGIQSQVYQSKFETMAEI
jgi:hypothetical protein